MNRNTRASSSTYFTHCQVPNRSTKSSSRSSWLSRWKNQLPVTTTARDRYTVTSSKAEKTRLAPHCRSPRKVARP